MRRVAVSGIGVVSPLGNSAAEVMAHARSGRSGVRRREMPFSSRLSAPIAATACIDDDTDLEPGKVRMPDCFSLRAWDGVARDRAGVFAGTGMGGTLTTESG